MAIGDVADQGTAATLHMAMMDSLIVSGRCTSLVRQQF
jgi:hypothetical protein